MHILSPGQLCAQQSLFPQKDAVVAAYAPRTSPAAARHLADWVGQKSLSNCNGYSMTARGRREVALEICHAGACMRDGKLVVGGDVCLQQMSGFSKRFAIRSLPPELVVQGRLTLVGCRNLRDLNSVRSLQALSVISSGLESITTRIKFQKSRPQDHQPQLEIDDVKDLHTVSVDGVQSISIHAAPELNTIDARGRVRALQVSNAKQLFWLAAGFAQNADLKLQQLPQLRRLALQSPPRLGDLMIDRCRRLKQINTPAIAADSLQITHCRQMRQLPTQLINIKDNLDLSNCQSLRELPAGLAIGKSCNLKNCRSLRSTPQGLSIAKNLYLQGTWSLRPLRSLPMLVDGHVYGLSSLTRLQQACRRAAVPKLFIRDDVQLASAEFKGKSAKAWRVNTAPVQVAGVLTGSQMAPKQVANHGVLSVERLTPSNSESVPGSHFVLPIGRYGLPIRAD